MRHGKHSFSHLAKRYEAQNLEAAQRILRDPGTDPESALALWAERVVARLQRNRPVAEARRTRGAS